MLTEQRKGPEHSNNLIDPIRGGQLDGPKESLQIARSQSIWYEKMKKE